MSLWLVGLGPSPELDDLTPRAERVLRCCEEVWLDLVTAGGGERRKRALEALLGRSLRLATTLDQQERNVLALAAQVHEVALAVAGDPLVATPHGFFLRELRARGTAVQVVPGLPAWTSVASLDGLDAAHVQVVVVSDPAAPTAPELQAIEQALGKGKAVTVLAAGREPEVPAEDWRQLADRWPGMAQAISLEGGGVTLLIRR
ncbi:MAG: SAM-dependent methyltransferase [Pseudomonadota bacterium]